MKQRNYSIDLLKFYFALIVAVGHSPYPSTLPYIEGGYIVLLFFILSGYFLVCSFDSGKYEDPWKYTMARVTRIWPYYAFAFVAMYLYMNYASGLRPLVLGFFRALPELLMLHNTGIFDGGINYPLWQLCSLVVVSHIFFGLLQWNRKLTLDVLCPVITMITYTYYIHVTPETALPYVNNTMIRAAGGVAMGMFLHRPIRLILEKLENSPLTCMPALVSGTSLFLMLMLYTNRLSYSMVIPYVGLLICMLYSRGIWARWFRHPALGRLDHLSLGVYLNHALIVRIVEQHPGFVERIPVLPQDLAFLLVVLVYTLVMMKTVDGLLWLWKKLLRKGVCV